MPTIRKSLILALLAVVAVVAIIAVVVYRNQFPPHERIRVGIATWPGFAIGFIGKERQLFPGLDVEIKIIDDMPARHAAFQSGDIDVMISSVDGFVQEYEQGVRGKIILVTDESFGGDGIVVKADIKSAADLRGKKVAFARATPSQFLLYKVLQKAGISLSDIDQVAVDDPGNAGQAFLGGSVDAAVTWEPFLTQVAKSGNGKVLATSRDFPDTIVDVLVASPQMLARKEALREFIVGWLRSVDYAQAHSSESLGIIAAGLNMKAEDAAGTMAGLSLVDRTKNEYFLCGPDIDRLPIAKIIDDAATFWLSQKIIAQKPTAADVVSTSLCDIGH
jgi:NitT/TauT family transport system substrate-binding protein